MQKIIYLLVAVSLMACNQKTDALLENTSADGQAKITVAAKRLGMGEPWQVDLKVKAYSFKEGLLKFEVYADDLTGENVKFNWTDAHNCTIVFTLRDKEERRFHLIAAPDQVQMAEVNADGTPKQQM